MAISCLMKVLPMFSWPIKCSAPLNEMVLFSWKIHGHEYSHEIFFTVFMGFSLDIHGIFIQFCFIVSFSLKQ